MTQELANGIAIAFGLAGVLVSTIGAYKGGKVDGKEEFKKQAVKDGRAKWVSSIDKNGDPVHTFAWIDEDTDAKETDYQDE